VLLYCDRRDLTARRLRDRRARLEDVIAGSDLIFPVRRLAPDGLEAWKQVMERGYEGYVAKDRSSAGSVILLRAASPVGKVWITAGRAAGPQCRRS
jgi:hypothetical protein